MQKWHLEMEFEAMTWVVSSNLEFGFFFWVYVISTFKIPYNTHLEGLLVASLICMPQCDCMLQLWVHMCCVIVQCSSSQTPTFHSCSPPGRVLLGIFGGGAARIHTYIHTYTLFKHGKNISYKLRMITSH